MDLKAGLVLFIMCIIVSLFAICFGIIGLIINNGYIGMDLMMLAVGVLCLFATIVFQVDGDNFNIKKPKE